VSAAVLCLVHTCSECNTVLLPYCRDRDAVSCCNHAVMLVVNVMDCAKKGILQMRISFRKSMSASGCDEVNPAFSSSSAPLTTSPPSCLRPISKCTTNIYRPFSSTRVSFDVANIAPTYCCENEGHRLNGEWVEEKTVYKVDLLSFIRRTSREESRYPNAEKFVPERFLDTEGMLNDDSVD